MRGQRAENTFRQMQICFGQLSAARREKSSPHSRQRSTPRPTRPPNLAIFSRRELSTRACTRFLPLLWNASKCIPTTIGRRFRHREPKILCFLYEFFLTSFPQPPILRFQARGRFSWPQRFLLPPTSRRAGPSLTENLEGHHPTERRASIFLRGLAGLLSLFFRREWRFQPFKDPATPH